MATSLSNQQAVELLKSPPNRQEIQDGNDYESALRIFTLPLLKKDLDRENAWTAFNDNLRNLLTPDKYNVVSKSKTYPLPINNLSTDIALDLYKVFDGRDASFGVNYPNNNSRAKELGDDVLAQLNVLNWIKREGKKVLKCAPNTVVVLDKDSKGDPLVLAIPNKRIYGSIQDDEGNFEVFMFVHSKGVDENKKPWIKYGFYDAFSYRVFLQTEGRFIAEPELTAPHDLGSCPARWFYDNPRVGKHHFDRSIPFTPVVGDMVTWQIMNLFDTSQYKFAAFQVVQMHANECDMPGCNDGVLSVDANVDEHGDVTKSAYTRDCPSCAKSALVGPGSAIMIEVGITSDDTDARDVFGFIAPDIPALEAAGKKNAQRKSEIKESVVGYSDAITSDAINPIQTMALVESRKLPLFDIKHHLEELYKWIVTGVIKLTYDIDVSVHANYGTEFFILTTSDIIDLISKAKLAGVQSSFIESLNRMLIFTKFKSDPKKVERMLISADLEPNAYDSQAEARLKAKEGSMNKEDYFIKSNFISLLREWEIEFGDIVSFAPQMEYSKKIAKIKNDLLMMAREKMPQEKEENETAESVEASGERA